jgi:hypothetical protein
MAGRLTSVAGSVLDGLSLESSILAAVCVAPQPQQHCRAAVL